MRSPGSFHPEWGYLAPAPSFLRTCRTVAISTAVGVTAGAAVVLALVDHPAATEHSVLVEPSVTAAALPAGRAVAQQQPVQAQQQPAQTMSAVPLDTRLARLAADTEKPETSPNFAMPQATSADPASAATADLPAAQPLPTARPTPASTSAPEVAETMNEPVAAKLPNQARPAAISKPVHVARARKRHANVVADRRTDYDRDYQSYPSYYDYYPRSGYAYQPSPYYRQW